ncbi:MAG: hypothetical protein AAF449_08985 [Myxococcota bacterium]
MGRFGQVGGKVAPSAALPTADPGRLASLTPTNIVVALLASRGELSDRQAVRAIATLVEEVRTEAALRVLARSAHIERRGSRWALTQQGWRNVLAAAIVEFGFEWRAVRDAVLPAVALKFVVSPRVVARLGRADGLRAAVLATTYGWPADQEPPLTLFQARGWLVAHALAAGFPGLKLPRGRHNGRLDAFSTSLLRGMAGLEAAPLSQTLHVLAARAVGAEDASVAALRRAIVRASLDAPVPTAEPRLVKTNGANPERINGDVTVFSERVRRIARATNTPPFTDRVAIASIYDAYGQTHADAGRMSEFKRRLVDAYRARLVSLRRLDYVEAIEVELAERSAIDVDGRAFHFVARDS